MYNLSQEQSIYIQATGFQKAASILVTKLLDDASCWTAMVTNSAFASELHLKCLILLETGQLVKSQHNLRKLFSKLRGKTQNAIETQFNEEMAKAPAIGAEAKTQLGGKKPPRTLREALKEGAEAFVTWRYVYENDNLQFFGLFPLPQILDGIILDQKPQWKDFKLTLAMLPNAPPASPAEKTP